MSVYTIICKSLRPLESWVYTAVLGLSFDLSVNLCGYRYISDGLIREVLWARIMTKLCTASYCMTFDISNKKGQKKQSVSGSKGPNSDPASWLLKNVNLAKGVWLLENNCSQTQGKILRKLLLFFLFLLFLFFYLLLYRSKVIQHRYL